ncbi:cytospin-B isoform X1 [Carassius gibelio]|uniref:cytospin-B isoform X1 n=1 Tax=Carassius gibelio TaxID=101364 RepID=UPI0022789089|nr:cytospin-B isoform X1 [Carassius gibelio]XP_052447903.1 cytospin-B isoform X1 [Carassius gibelio]XP_052447904.1 cytospin-B isoform X1 [Carassius gibelio]XP_052447905.1 cytospin-B isoform X1 [Carassius gibelio]XP_052447906.1 cytospin-B isoform X1 [Carassius gibelio]XP_052447907.1 cytospin-B isoform X1 [Carassius gibelio]XP_052447908.1 cytospin-B isoform X1 [Carassius gibelio]
MLKGGTAKAALSRMGAPERAKLSTTSSQSTYSSNIGMKTSRSSSTIASDLRLSKIKRASSDDTLAKPVQGTGASVSRIKKTVTTGAISELSDNRPRSTSSVQSTKKSGIPAPREIPQSISRERVSLRDQQKSTTAKKMVTSASTSSLSTLTKHSRGSVKTKAETVAFDKNLLESQVRELLTEAKTKEFEISKLRMELQRHKGKDSPSEVGTPEGNSEIENTPAQSGDIQVLVGELREKNGRFQRELATLREENQALKQKLITLENSTTLVTSSSKHSVNGVDPKGSPIHSSESSEFEKIPSLSDSVSSSIKSVVPSGTVKELSVASLTDRIQKMEESHHSTAEELQATLQELADQQQVVQELTAENERLVEEKGLLQTSLQQQRERVELLAQQNESLLQRVREQAQCNEAEASRASRIAELEQRLAEQVESSHFEREKLVDIQQQLTGSLRALEMENQEAQIAVKSLKEEVELLQGHLEDEKVAKDEAERKTEEQRLATEALRAESASLKAQVEVERQKIAELKAVQSASDNTELQSLLKAAHEDRDKLELSCMELRQELQQVEADRQQLLERVEKQEQDHKASMLTLDEKNRDAENQIKDLKETIFELEDQVEQQRAVRLHTNQTILDLENQIKRLEENKAELEKQIKAMNKQMKDETEEWRRFQADLQTAVVVANDIKVEAQQELRTLHRRLQEEQEHSARLASELEQIQGARSWTEDVSLSDTDGSPHWSRMTVSQNATGGYLTNGNGSGSSMSSEPGAMVKSLIKSFDTAVPNGPSSSVQMHTSPRSPLSGIPVRTAPAAAVSPIQRHSGIKPLSKTLVKKIAFGDFPHNGSCDQLKPSSLMRKSPSLESVIKTPAHFNGHQSSFTHNRANSKLNVERTDPLSALAREYGGSKRNALLKWCQKKTEGYPNIDVTNFSSSWSDGLAFCALLHTYLPAHIPYQELISQDKGRNLTLAFQAAESIGIKPSLDINELMHTDRPDWQSVMQYVSQIYKYFET